MARNSFKKGNPYGGRPKGSKNLTSSKVREGVQKLLDDNMDEIQNDLDHLEPRDRIKFLLDLMNFTIPKMKSVESTVTNVNELSAEKIESLERMQELVDEIEAERINPNIAIDE